MTSEATSSPDPFFDEAVRHGWKARRFDNLLRDRCRENADECSDCAALIEAFDAEFQRAFFAGTGPFG